MRVVVRAAAASDIEEAYRWYEGQRRGLGEEFLDAVQQTLDQLLANPEAHMVIHRETRRALVPRRFPYGVFYRVYGETLVVVACMHASRDPQRWRER